MPESRRGIYKIVWEHDRALGVKNRNTEALHPTAKERYDSPQPVYKPGNLTRYLGRPGN